nr:adenylate cyclase type 10-like [Chrysemys picta bellii]
MMMYYPGLVSCDAVTYANSRLPHCFFEELPQAEMKGVVNPGVVYQYLGISEKPMIGQAYLTKERSEYYHLLGRWTELFGTPVGLSFGTCGAVVAAGKRMPKEAMDVGGNV